MTNGWSGFVLLSKGINAVTSLASPTSNSIFPTKGLVLKAYSNSPISQLKSDSVSPFTPFKRVDVVTGSSLARRAIVCPLMQASKGTKLFEKIWVYYRTQKYTNHFYQD